VLYTLTYHVALVSGRDVSGKEAKAKALVYSNAMLQTADTARADDMWDMQCMLSCVVKVDALTTSLSSSRSR
jgi:hypothetical protein